MFAPYWPAQNTRGCLTVWQPRRPSVGDRVSRQKAARTAGRTTGDRTDRAGALPSAFPRRIGTTTGTPGTVVAGPRMRDGKHMRRSVDRPARRIGRKIVALTAVTMAVAIVCDNADARSRPRRSHGPHSPHRGYSPPYADI